MPSTRQSVATSTRLACSPSASTRASRSSAASVPGDRLDLDVLRRAPCAARRRRTRRSAMKRQKTIGLKPSRDELLDDRRCAFASFASLVARERVGLARQVAAGGARSARSARRRPRRRRRRATTSTPSALSSSLGRGRCGGRSRRPPRRVAASAVPARLAQGRGAAAGLEASARRSASADHQRTRWRWRAVRWRRAPSRGRRRARARRALRYSAVSA